MGDVSGILFGGSPPGVGTALTRLGRSGKSGRGILMRSGQWAGGHSRRAGRAFLAVLARDLIRARRVASRRDWGSAGAVLTWFTRISPETHYEETEDVGLANLEFSKQNSAEPRQCMERT